MFNNYPYNNIYQPNTNNLIFVNGIEGAKSYQIQPSQIVMLLDSDNPIVYKKTSNSFGQATIESYKMVPITETEIKGATSSPEYVLKSDFDALVKRIDELTKKEE